MASIQKRKQTSTGAVSYRVQYRDPENRMRSRSFKKVVDARAFAAEVEHKINTGSFIDRAKSRTTVAAFVENEKVMEHHGADQRPATRSQQETLLRKHILPTFGKRPLLAVTRSEVQKWTNKLAEKYAPSTVRQAKLLLGVIFAEAVERDYIGKSPVRRIKLPPITRSEMRVLTLTEVERLADAIDERYRALVSTAAYTGCRFGELAALRVGRDGLDLLHRRLTVTGTMSEVGGEVTINEPKTDAGRRVITLPAFLVDELAAHLAAQKRGPGDFVFAAPNGGPLRRSSWRSRYWLPAVAAADLDGVTFHSLRHTAASLLINAGENVKVVQERMGHSSTRITLDTYSHLWPGSDEAAAAKLDELWEASAG